MHSDPSSLPPPIARLVRVALERGYLSPAGFAQAEADAAASGTPVWDVIRARHLSAEHVAALQQVDHGPTQLTPLDLPPPAGELPAPPAIPPRRSTEAPASLGGYRIEGELGKGGMGAVYLAQHPTLGRQVAVKVLLPGVDVTPERIERFQAEARAAGRLDHPHIVAVHDVGHDATSGQWFMVMDYVPGESLKERLERDGPLAPVEAAGLLRTAAEAMACAHDASILHRDLKPANILLDARGQPRIADFGLAKDVTRQGVELTATGQVLGTPAYMPPEQLDGEPDEVDARADVYALGATLYELLCGEPPFTGDTAINVMVAITMKEPEPLRKRDPRIPPDLGVICLKCLEKRPADRYASAQELADDLGRFLDHLPIVAKPPGPLLRLRKLVRRNRAAATVGAVALVLAGAGGAALVWRGEGTARAAAETARKQAEQRAAEERAAADRRADAETATRLDELFAGLPADPAADLAPAVERVVAHAAERPRATRDLLLKRIAARVRWLEARALDVLGPPGLADGAQALRRALAADPFAPAPAAWRRALSALDTPASLLAPRERLARAARADPQREHQALVAYRAFASLQPSEASIRAVAEAFRVEWATRPAVAAARALVAWRRDGLALVLRERRALPPGTRRRRLALILRGLTDPQWSPTAAAADARAELALDARDPVAATRWAERACELEPERPGAWLLAAHVAQAADRLKAADAALSKAAALAPDDPRLALARAHQARIAGQTERLPALLAAVDRVPSLRPAAGWVQATRTDLAHAERQRWVAAALEAAPREAGLHVAAAYLLLAQQQGARAADEYGEASALEPESALRCAEAARALRAVDADGSLRWFGRAVAIAPRAVGIWSDYVGLLLRLQRLDEADRVTARLVQALPREGQAWRLRALVLGRRAQRPAQLEALRRACAVDPGTAIHWANLGRALRGASDPGAAEAFAKALELDPDCWLVHADRAERHLLAGRGAEALEAARRCRGRGPRTAVARLEGEALLLLKRPREALQVLQLAESRARQHPSEVKLYLVLARAQRALGRLRPALASIRQAQALAPRDPAPLLELATLELSRRRPKQALAALRAASALEPDSVWLLNLRWQAHLANQDRARALADLRALRARLPAGHPQRAGVERALRAVERGDAAHVRPTRRLPPIPATMRPADAKLATALDAQLRAGDLTGALRRLDREVDGHPRDPSLRRARAHVRALAGLGRQQLEDLDAALASEPDHLACRLARARLLRRVDPAKALGDLERAVALAPKDPRPLEERARLRLARKQLPLAEADLDQALRLAPGRASARALRGRVRYFQRRYPDAEADLRRALKRTPRDAQTLLTLAFTLEAQSRLAEALTCADRALQAPRPPTHALALRGILRARLGRAGAKPDLVDALRRLPQRDPLRKQVQAALLELGAGGD